MAKKPTVYEFIPKLGQLRDEVLFGDVWEHPDLRGHMQRALDNGVTQTELKGLITHVAFYAGWPCAVNAGRIAIDVFGPK
jgi:4-carboxymuconolactone decarboxylase